MNALPMNIFFDFFSNISNILFFVIAIAVGIIVGIFLVQYVLKPKNQILYCRERDGRGLELKVNKEDAVSLETMSSPELRFFKYGRSYEFRKKGRAFTRFFGKEGTAYSWRLQGFSKVPSEFKDVTTKTPVLTDDEKPILDKNGETLYTETIEKVPTKFVEKQIELEFPTLEDAVKHQWGEEFYSSVPDPKKDILKDNKLLVTVNLEPGIVPEGYEPITESVIKKKANEDMAELMAHSLKGAVKKSILDVVPWLLAGAGITAIVSKLLGWW